MIFKLGQSYSEEFTIGEKIYNGFIDLFLDENPLHTCNDFAVGKGFREAVMHGNILNGFLSYFIGERLDVKDVIIHSQEIKYLNPLYLNDILQFNAEITGIYESVNAIEFKYQFINQEKTLVSKGRFQIGLL